MTKQKLRTATTVGLLILLGVTLVAPMGYAQENGELAPASDKPTYTAQDGTLHRVVCSYYWYTNTSAGGDTWPVKTHQEIKVPYLQLAYVDDERWVVAPLMGWIQEGRTANFTAEQKAGLNAVCDFPGTRLTDSDPDASFNCFALAFGFTNYWVMDPTPFLVGDPPLVPPDYTGVAWWPPYPYGDVVIHNEDQSIPHASLYSLWYLYNFWVIGKYGLYAEYLSTAPIVSEFFHVSDYPRYRKNY